MPQEIEKDLLKCEQALYEMQKTYPALARVAAESRIIYDVAWANAIDELSHQAVAEGTKPPTVAVMEARATKMVESQMELARKAEAELDAAKKHLDSLQAILSSVQTRSKLIQLEMGLAR